VQNKLDDLLNFIQKMIEISKDINADHKEAIICFRIIQVMLENLIGLIDPLLKQIISLLNQELETKAKSYKSMILQTFSMCFVYNSKLTF